MRLGIDFGTTRTVVAAADRGNYPVVTFDGGDGAVYDWSPSVVAIRGQERAYGWDAWSKQEDPGWIVVRSLKRILENAGPQTILEIDRARVPLITVITEMAASIKSALIESSSLNVGPGEKFQVMLGVPATAHGNQRFLTVEAFQSAGFEVLGLLNEPSAASLEFSHKNRVSGRILVYDLGGGTFDASLVEVNEKDHSVIASEGIPTLGGDDFDHILASMALEAAGIPSGMDGFSQAELFRLNEQCRLKKEDLHPNTRKIVVELDELRDGLGEVSILASAYYEECRPLIEETVRLVEDLIAAQTDHQIEALYITGGGSELPSVARVLREAFGRRVRRSAYTRSATAIGLAIQADAQLGYVLREKFNRYFGVWREANDGQRVVFDPLFAKGALLPPPGGKPLEIRRQYCPAHNIGHFRYLECSQVSPDGEPQGDLTAWDDILFPFDPSLREAQVLTGEAVRRRPEAASERIEERYSADAGGVVTVTIRNLTSGYGRDFRLGRWASQSPATVRPRRRHKAK
jgi:molecular chaperone DnaK (HSP70)